MRPLMTLLAAGLVLAACEPSPGEEPLSGQAQEPGTGVRRQALEPGEGAATFDTTWAAPACATVGSRCDSVGLLVGRGSFGPEPHQPNTVGGSCADGTTGTAGYIASLDRLVVSRSDGTAFAAGKEVQVEATVTTNGAASNQALDLYVAADPGNPSWTWVDTVFPPSEMGTFTLTSRYLIPAGTRHALRGVSRTNGRATPPVPCLQPTYSTSPYDHDDLVIAVGQETDTTPPSVALTSPVEGATLVNTVNVHVTAGDDFGVSRVELYDGTTLLGSATRAPSVLSWATRTASNGPHTLTARAYDQAGNVSSTAPVHVLVDNDLVAPQVAFVTPGAGATVSGTVSLQAQASDDRGTVYVSFYVDDVYIGSTSTPPYTVSWNSRVGAPTGPNGVNNGPHVLKVTAHDASGNAAPPRTVNVLVDNDYVAPTTTITSHVDGAVLTGLVTLEATASDNLGIAQVSFYVRGVLAGIDTTPPYSVTWDSAELSNGSHELLSEALDVSGNSTHSTRIAVITNNPGSVRYDPVLKVPRCDAVVANCDSRDLLREIGGSERNSPNTLDGCVDGRDVDSSRRRVDRIRVIREDGTLLAVGKRVRLVVDVWSGYAPGDRLDLYYMAEAARGGAWTHLTTLQPADEGAQTLSAEYVLPAGASQAVRARFLSTGDLSPGTCQTGNRTDRDDLVFAVAQEADTVPPHDVVLTAPAEGAAVTRTVTLTAVASDNFGVAAVDFYDGDTLIGTDTQAPFSVSWNSRQGPNGARVLTARARDLAGNATPSPPVTVTASNDLSVPTVVLTAPLPGERLTRVVDFAAEATDPEGITLVEFYSGDRLIGSDATAPYACTCDTKITGPSWTDLTARAYDAAGNVGVSAPVRVHVTVELNPPSVSLTAPASGARLGGTVTISASASDGSGVSRVEFLVDGVLLGSVPSSPYPFSWNTRTVADGAHALSARATDVYGNTATSTVNVTVDNAGPTVAITSPASEAWVNGLVSLQASATDGAGVSSVSFYVDGSLLRTDSSAPYEASWNSSAAADGAHTLSAQASDALGNVSSSVGVVVRTDRLSPSAVLTAPSPGAFLRGSVELTANASDNQEVERVEFYDGTSLVGTDTHAPYAVSWNTAGGTEGARTLTVKAVDRAGNTSTSAAVGVSVDNTAPTTALGAPAQNARLRGTVLLSATASDAQGVDRVEFYAGPTLLGTDTSAPHEVSWDTTATVNGSVTLTTRAYDAAGNLTVSAGVAVLVDNSAPTVAITSPANGASLFLSTTLQASASDNVGVTQVVFYDGTKVLGTDTSAPYSYSWNLLSATKGNHTLTAKAYDAAGNVTTSTAVTVKVN